MAEVGETIVAISSPNFFISYLDYKILTSRVLSLSAYNYTT
jgi:hypothetical protein